MFCQDRSRSVIQYVLRISIRGTLLRLPDSKNMCFVQVGAMKTKTKLENLRLVERKRERNSRHPQRSERAGK
ncbi:MAG: MutS2/Smr-associated SH3 domain-containing protein [[Eubacterium] siraeum]